MPNHITELALLVVGLLPALSKAFTSISPITPHPTRGGLTRLHYEDEKIEIEPVTVERAEEEESIALTDAERTQKTVGELTKTRPYPLFVTEKVLGTVERTAKGIGRSIRRISQTNDQDDQPIPQKKAREKIVCLGVGWGSAAFLADIDTDLYDVTVISPRNHFVFTPSE